MDKRKRCEVCGELAINLYCENFNTCPMYCDNPSCREKAIEIMDNYVAELDKIREQNE